jgi:DNA-binding transcriptional LysR family regulator
MRALMFNRRAIHSATERRCERARAFMAEIKRDQHHRRPGAQPAQRFHEPKLNVSVTAANRYFDLIESGVDIAIRTREHEADSALVIRRLAETRRILAASPEYLSRHGTPKSIEELDGHRFLIYTLANNPYDLAFTKSEITQTVKINGLLESNEGQVICKAGLNGLGIVIQPVYIIHDELVAGAWCRFWTFGIYPD